MGYGSALVRFGTIVLSLFAISATGSDSTSPAVEFMKKSNLTILQPRHLDYLFVQAAKSDITRTCDPEGNCAVRWADFEKAMARSGMKIRSAALVVGCNGRYIHAVNVMNGTQYFYNNFHVANVVTVEYRPGWLALYVMDPQFQIRPRRLNDYLADVMPHRDYHHFSKKEDGRILKLKTPGCRWLLESEYLTSYLPEGEMGDELWDIIENRNWKSTRKRMRTWSAIQNFIDTAWISILNEVLR